MRYISSLFAVLLLSAFVAGAQTDPRKFPLFGTSLSTSTDGSAAGTPATAPPTLNLFTPAISVSTLSTGTPSAGASSTAEPAVPQVVTGVFENYSWQVAGGYTFIRFYELPAVTQNMNGFNFSLVYYFKGWIGADGEFAAAFGSQSGVAAHYLFGGGGPRFRWSAPRGLEVWGHGLLGHTHFTPQTADGPQGAFAYELGAGVDINAHHQRWAYRIEGDVIGSHYFGTYQFSPKISAGLVFKF
jgi:hypothetical protein